MTAFHAVAAYVFRVAVTERRITDFDGHEDMDVATVRLQLKCTGTHKYRGMPLTVAEFICRYLQHVLPSGFQKVRHFGILHPSNATPRLLICWLVAIANDRAMELCRTEVVVNCDPPGMRCSSCGGLLVCCEITLADGLRIAAHLPPEAA